MIKKKSGILLTIISISIAVVLSGCTTQTDTTAGNANKVVANNANTAVVLPNNSVQENTTQTAVTPPDGSASSNNSPTADMDQPSNKKTATKAANDPTPEIGSGANDMLLVIQARNALAKEDKKLDVVIVDSKEGNVVLTGKLPTAADKAKAGQIVQGIKGIKAVKNDITVSN